MPVSFSARACWPSAAWCSAVSARVRVSARPLTDAGQFLAQDLGGLRLVRASGSAVSTAWKAALTLSGTMFRTQELEFQ